MDVKKELKKKDKTLNEIEKNVWRYNLMKVAIITASTAVYKGEQEDASGKVIRKMVEEDRA